MKYFHYTIFTLILCLLIGLPQDLFSQSTQNNGFTAQLCSLMELSLPETMLVEVQIRNNNGTIEIIPQTPDIEFSVISTSNWKLVMTFRDSELRSIHNPDNTIPLNAVGLEIEAVGKHKDDGTNIINFASDEMMAVGQGPAIVMQKGTHNNKGNAEHNAFVISWKNNPDILLPGNDLTNFTDDIYTAAVSFSLAEDGSAFEYVYNR